MDKFVTVMGIAVLAASSIGLFVIFGTLAGGCAGWIVGLFFSDTILGIAAQLGIKGVSMFQLGAFLGFIGGFLKTKVTAEVKAAK